MNGIFRIAVPRQLDDKERGWANRSKGKYGIAPWQPCNILSKHCTINNNDEVERRFVVNFGNQRMDLPVHQIAEANLSEYFHSGARVVAFRRNIDLPYTIDPVTCEQVPIYQGLEERKPYPGMLVMASEKGLHQMVFFDDGHVQKVRNIDIRMGFDSKSLEHGECGLLFAFNISFDRVFFVPRNCGLKIKVKILEFLPNLI